MFQSHSVRETALHTKPITDIKWNCDGSYLSAASYDKTVKIHILESNGSIKMLQSIPCIATPSQICWHPNNPERFAIISDDKNVELWDVKGTSAVLKIPTLGGNINISWSPDGKYLAVGNKADNLIIIEVSSLKQIKKYKSANGTK